ncbi:MAG: hypothetical protein AAF471_08925, partial [Myxococcota bacterium]
GNILYGLHIGTFEPNQSKPLARGVPNETLKVLRQGLDKAVEDDKKLQTKQRRHQEKLQDLEEKLAQAREQNEKLTKQATETARILKRIRHNQLYFQAKTLVSPACWERFSLPNNINALCLGRDDRGECHTAVGNGICKSDSTLYDGKNRWKPTHSPTSQTLNAIAYSHFAKNWLAVGDSGTVCCSSAYSLWHLLPAICSQALNDCVSFKNSWIIVGHGGTILSANNNELQAWVRFGRDKNAACPLVAHDVPTQVHLRCVAGNHDCVIAAGDEKTILFSEDGTTWRQAKIDGPLDILATLRVRRLVWDPNRKTFLALLSPTSGSCGRLCASDDGKRWHCGIAFTKTESLADLATGNGFCIAIGEDGKRIRVGDDWKLGRCLASDEADFLGNRIVSDCRHFYRFQSGGKTVWRSRVQFQ